MLICLHMITAGRFQNLKELIEKINSNFYARYNYKNNKQYSYQIILQDNLQQLSNFISDKKKELEIIIPTINLDREDYLKLREKILSMNEFEIIFFAYCYLLQIQQID